MRDLRHTSVSGFVAAFGAALLLVGCAKSVTLDTTGAGGDTTTVTSGTGGTGGAATTTTTTTGGTGGSGPCTSAEECAALTDACNIGTCINGVCDTLPGPDGTACDDGKQCTQNDYCKAGVCTGGTLKSCAPPGNPCQVGVCDPVTDTCQTMAGNNGAFCNLGDACVLSASCLNGICQPNQIQDCSFLNSACADGYCDQQGGCKTIPKNDGALCDDFLFCTVEDQCVMGQCKGKPNTCVPPSDVCKVGVCNEAQKTCVAVPGNNGVACDDGNLCTAGETCSNGTCLGGAPANNGVMCDDQNGCTGGTTCSNGVCTNAQSEIMACVDGDMCCPAGCAADKDCLWWVSGVQLNIPETQLTGWSQCYSDVYGNGSTPMSQILQQCDKAKLMLACRPIGATTFTTLAMAPRADALHDCGSIGDCTFQSNGVGWYYSDSYSWGYAPAGEPVSRNSCDTFNTQNQDRLCWHSGGGFINGGWRCGATTGLNGDLSWERAVFEAD